jgi:beta-galactosidase
MASVLLTTATARERVLIDSNWRFQLGDPTDVTTDMAFYPEIPYLPRLYNFEFSGSYSETYMETNRPDPIATHAGENVSFVQTNYDDSAWRLLNLPHDWAVELPFDQNAAEDHGYKSGIIGSTSPNTIAWYRHTFTLPANYAGQALWLEFDGVYRNCLVWLNGHILGRNVSGYDSFSFDITPYANPGGANVLVVRVDASNFEGWFYEGAGIYRHVWMVAANPVHVAHWGTYVATTNLAGSNATITVQTDVTNQSGTVASGNLTSTILDANSNAVTAITSAISVPARNHLVVTQTVTMPANLWSLQTPYLYNLVSAITNQNAVADVCNTTFGVRMVRFDPTNGVFINGQHVEIQGMCNHQDHAGVGSALPDRLQYFRIERLKEMGCNAIRTSHNAPTPELLNACDQLGMLVLDENRRFGTNVEPLFELKNDVMRDRNHPSVFAWSLANEEFDLQSSPTGQVVMAVMQNLVHSLDSTRKCTAAINGSLGGTGFTAVLDVQGLNYNIPGNLDSYHSSNPNSPIIGTEVGTTVTTRGIYTNDKVNGYVASYDIITMSGLPNPVTWGETAEAWWQYYSARPWSSGGFDWTGFDYRGEPTPYYWPCINSHFGAMDTCGFPKDLFYYYQANWSLKPVLHVFPHWNWPTTGQFIDVWVYGNCDLVELFLNGVSQGMQALAVADHVDWYVPYAAGTLQAVGYRNGEPVMTNTVTTTGTPAKIALWPDRSTILADGRDVSVVTVAVLDSSNRVVPIATNLINFTIIGGAIIGVGNGNPSCHEADKGSNQRSVFNGYAQVIVQSANQTGPIVLGATASGLASTNAVITAAATLPAPDAPGGVAAVAGADGPVTISWDVVPGAVTYKVKRATVIGGPYTVIASNVGSLGLIDTALTNHTIYYYVVSAVNANGESADSIQVSATTQFPNAPTAPTGLMAIAGDEQVSLSWTASSGATSYKVKSSTTRGGPYTTVMNVATTNFVAMGLTNSNLYYFVVSALNFGGESTNSSEADAMPIAVVSGLTANVVNSQVQLQWNAHDLATGYNVKRALVSGGPYTIIAASLSTTNYMDSAVSICQTYYYVVTITNAGNESIPPAEVSATLPGMLPPQFTNADVGAVGLAGSASFCGGQFTVSGSGADITGTSDAFQFVYVYVPVSTNCDIRARVVSISDTDPGAKAGVMIRESLAPNSRNAYMAISYANGATFQYRSATNSATQSTAATGAAPYWVRVTRTNNTFRVYLSPDGTSWTSPSHPTISMAGTGAYIGLAVTAHNNGLLNSSVFDNVSASFLTNAPPVISWVVPANNSTLIQPRTITLTASATDADGMVTNVAFFNGTTLLGNVTAGDGSQYSLTWSNATVGNYNLSVSATDNSGATNKSPATIAIAVQPLTLTLPGTQINGQFSLTFQGQNRQNYMLETSTNLADWTPVWTNAPTNGVLMFTNVNATDRSRFYRVRQ